MDRVVISPEPFVQKCKSLAKAKNPYLDVLDGRVVLAWMEMMVQPISWKEQMSLGLAYLMICSLMLFQKLEVRLM
jgi:hypothetical protein